MPEKKYRLLSWNVNGIRAIQKKGFLDWFKKENPDVLCLQETKAHPDQLDDALKNVKGYESHFSWAEKKGYSGVVTYTKLKPVKVQQGIGKKEFDSEGRFIITEFDEFTLFNIYFPNGKASAERLQYKMDFYDSFLKHCKKLLKQNKKIVVCGDVNTAHKEIDLARPKENSQTSGFLIQEREWIDEFLAAGFLDTFRMFNDEPEQYTWWSYRFSARAKNVGWRIDYFCINEPARDMVKKAEILKDVMGSDHCPVLLEIQQ